jgi:hypothetical protein
MLGTVEAFGVRELAPALEFLHSRCWRDAQITTGSNDSQLCGASF